MSHIRSVRTHTIQVPLIKPFITAVRSTTTLETTMIEVVDSQGRQGWGEAPTTWRVTGESTASVRAAIEGPLSEAVIGMPANDPTAVSERITATVAGNASARSGLECAAWDLAARCAELPLYRYLGGNNHRVSTDMTLSASVTATEQAAAIQSAIDYSRAGFSTLKIKTGAGHNDLALIKDIRAAVGPTITLRVDANQAWDRDEAVRVINAWDDAQVNLELIEQPVHRDDIRALAYVHEHTHTPVFADETVMTRRNLDEVITLNAVSGINIKLAKTGGIAEALALGAHARAHGVSAIVGCMAESHVGIASAAAVASALQGENPSTMVNDLDGGLWLKSSPAVDGPYYEGAHIVLSSQPGTGITRLTAP